MSLSSLKDTVGSNAVLGKTVSYPDTYDANLLFAVSRENQRTAMGFCSDIQFHGVDIWNVYEFCYLNSTGKPVRKSLSLHIPANSKFLPESKSVKLYFNSFNFTQFSNEQSVIATIKKDLEKVCQTPIEIFIEPVALKDINEQALKEYRCIDEENATITTYQRDISLLAQGNTTACEKLVSHLFKSHCLCTGQPDWGSIFIEYEGQSICHKSLLAYLISYNRHVGFSENCIEQIFMDLMSVFKLEKLTVFGRFLRRGGIDINPYRSTHEQSYNDLRLYWQ